MARQWTGKWAGGRTRLGRDGKPVWVIEAMRKGASYSISLPVHSEPEALAELALFERDPVAYKASLETGTESGTESNEASFSVANVLAFLQAKQSDVTKGHAWALAHYLRAWQKALNGKDLRRVTLAEYKAHLRTMEPKRQHIVALRSFTKWLRQEGKLSSAVDSSRDMPVPQPKPRRAAAPLGYTMEEFAKLYFHITGRPKERAGGERKFPQEIMEAALARTAAGEPIYKVAKALGVGVGTMYYWRELQKRDWKVPERLPTRAQMEEAQAVRDVLALRALTGLHYSEICRIARGEFKVAAVANMGDIAGTVKVLHKSGVIHPQSLTHKALAAALRIQARQTVPTKDSIHGHMDRAAAAAGLRKMRPGELRHSFVTWARTYGRVVRPAEGGVPLDVIAAVVGHRTVKTTAKFYDNTEVPPLVVLPLKLENRDDPEGL